MNQKPKFFKEDCIRLEMKKTENLIEYFESRGFDLKYGIQAMWSDYEIKGLIKQAKYHLQYLSKQLFESVNYK